MTRKCADQTDKKDWEALGNGALSSIWLVPGVTKRDETNSQNMAQNLKTFACKTENATSSRINTMESQHAVLILGKGPVSICWDLPKLQLSQAHQQGEKNNYMSWQISQDTCFGDLLLPSCAPPLHRLSRSSPSSVSIWLTAPDLPFSATGYKLFTESQRPWSSWVCVLWTFLDLLVALFYLVELWQQFLWLTRCL